MRRFVLILIVAALGCFGCARQQQRPVATVAENPAYKIRLEQPARAGDRGRLEIIVAETTTDQTRWSGYPQIMTSTYTRGSRLVGDFEILGADKLGNVTSLACTVESCSKFAGSDGSDEQTLLQRGDRLVARETRTATAFLVNGKKADAGAEAFLALLIRLEAKAREVSQDDVFGTREKKHVGDTWPINGAVMAKHYAAYDTQLAPEDVVGSVKLAGVESVHGEPCLKVEAEVELKRFSPATRPTRGEAYTRGSSTGRSTWWTPLNSQSMVEQHESSYVRRYKLQGVSQLRRYLTDRAIQTETATRVVPASATTAPSPTTLTSAPR